MSPSVLQARAFDALVLDRDAVLGGELWRLWSGHWVHLDPRHAAINLVALVLMALIAARMRLLRPLLVTSLLMLPLIAAGLLLAVPDLQWYAGLSGLLHGWAAWLLLRRGGRIALIGTVLLAGKLIAEQWTPVAGVAAFPVIHAAHVTGAIVGAALAVPGALRQRRLWPR
ncbi:rhombosortase [Luteimonas sp. WGS1318]|uniref:rhombosortase n=1 Tax=Luteimonas sp. WGS1318 TaxID=3366815 RepID=UPI00372D2C18